MAVPAAPQEPVLALPGRVCVLDAGVPWPRTAGEFAREFVRLKNLTTSGLFENRGDAFATQGAYRACLWFLGEVDRIVCPEAHRPTGRTICEEMEAAREWMVSRRPGWEGATGVVGYLLWVTGATDDRFDVQHQSSRPEESASADSAAAERA